MGVVTRETRVQIPGRTAYGAWSGTLVANRLVSVGVLLAATAVVLQTVGHLTNAFLFDYEIWNLDADMDGNAPSWASSVATFGAAFSAFLLGLVPMALSRRLLVLAGILAFFSLDDIVAIHEKVSIAAAHDLGVGDGAARALWPLLYLPLLAFVSLTLWRLSGQAQGSIRRAIVVGLALLVLAVFAEASSTLWSSSAGARPLAYDLEVAVEEGAELGGWILIAFGLSAILVTRLRRLGAGPA